MKIPMASSATSSQRVQTRVLVVFQPLPLEFRAHETAQPPLQRFGNVYAHAARMVEQFCIDEQVDGALLDRPFAHHRGGLTFDAQD
jgi:hypothetical protein